MEIKIVKQLTGEILDYIQHKYDTLENFKDHSVNLDSFGKILEHSDVFIVRSLDGSIKALMVTNLCTSFLDNKIRTLSLIAMVSDSNRASVMLLRLFIDMGNKFADHVLMSKGVSTNLKHSTLVKLGFKPLETVYKMEV